MSNADKCPDCGAAFLFVSDGTRFHECGTIGSIQSEYCRERTANGKPTDEPNPNGSTNARLNWWKQRCDTISDELTREREKWWKLREWAKSLPMHMQFTNVEMNRLDAEAKEDGK